MKADAPLPPEPWLPDLPPPRVYLLVTKAEAARLAAGRVPLTVRDQARRAGLNFSAWVAQCRAPKATP